jgi:hypothetical protein
MVCQLGTCQACPAIAGENIVNCNSECIDVSNDVNNCGACGVACGLIDSCQAGACAAAPTPATHQDAPQDVAVDTVNVYWTNAGTAANNYTDGTVVKMPLAGGTPTTLATGQDYPVGIVSDGVNVFWASLGTVAGGYTDGKVQSVPIAGGAATLIAGSQVAPTYVSYTSTNLVWTNQGVADSTGSLMTVPLAGGAVTALATGLKSPLQILVDGTNNNIYWTDYGTSAGSYADGDISWIPGAGGTVTVLATNQQSPYGIVGGEITGGLIIIWTNVLGGTVEGVLTTAGSTPFTLASGQSSPEGLAIGTQGLYWTDTGSGTIMTEPYLGATPSVLASGQASPDSIAADASGNVWWANVGTAANGYTDGTIVKSAP